MHVIYQLIIELNVCILTGSPWTPAVSRFRNRCWLILFGVHALLRVASPGRLPLNPAQEDTGSQDICITPPDGTPLSRSVATT